MRKTTFFKTLLVAACLCLGSMSAWAGTTTYDLKSLCSGGDLKLNDGYTLGSTLFSADGVNFQLMTVGENTLDNHLAINNGGQWLRSGYGLFFNTKNRTRYFAITNLKNGDVVNVVFNKAANTTLTLVNDFQYTDNGIKTIEAGSMIASNTNYTVYTEEDSYHLVVKCAIPNENYQNWYVEKFTITTTSENIAKPTIAITGVNGGDRTITITGNKTDADNNTITYYTIDGNTPTYNNTEYTVPFTVGSTDDTDEDGYVVVKAITYKDGDTSIESEVTTLSVAVGTPVSLDVPTIALSAMTDSESTGVYNPTYSFSSNQSSILGSPTATLTYSFAGGAATEGTSYTATTTGTLTVTASAEGYTSAQLNITVSKVGFKLTDNIDVADFYGDYAGNDNKEWPTGLDYELIPRVTISPIHNEQGCTYRTAHGSTIYNTLYARNKAFTATCSGLTEDELVFFADYEGNNYAAVTSTANTTSVSKDGSIKYYSLYVQPTLTQSITVGSAKWKTLCSPYSLDFTSVTGLTAYIVTGATGSTLNLTAVKKVPARTGILLSGAANTYTVPVIAKSAATDVVSGNKLVGVVANKTKAAESIYVLMGSPNVGFYNNTNEFTVGANTAYLPANFAGARSFFGFDDEETTGIADVREKTEDGRSNFFDLQGRRVAQPTKGLYIVNGRKIVIK